MLDILYETYDLNYIISKTATINNKNLDEKNELIKQDKNLNNINNNI
jgi:hypothetical protein